MCYRRCGLTPIEDVIYLRLQFCVSDVKSQETRVSNDPSHRRPGLLIRVSNNPGAESVLIGDAAYQHASPICDRRRRLIPRLL